MTGFPSPPNPYGQPSQSPYGQPPQSPYGQPPQNPYGQSPYGQPPQSPYGQPPPNPFAQAGGSFNPYAPPSSQADQQFGMQGFELEAPLAERGTRLGASMLDGMLYLGAAVLVAIVGAAGGEELAIAGGVLGYLAMAAFQWYLISTTGQSLAKKWLGIRIVKLDGSLPGFVNGVVLRVWVLGIAGAFLGFLPLIDALLIFGDERRCLHDHIASTKVVVA